MPGEAALERQRMLDLRFSNDAPVQLDLSHISSRVERFRDQ
jgi:hypothetical protein